MRPMPIVIPCKRVFTGSNDNEIGIIPRNRLTQKPISDNEKSEEERLTRKEQQNLDHFLNHKNWLSYTEARFEDAEVKRRVQELFCEENNRLRQRQERLKTLLRSEEYKFYNELTCMQETKPDKEEKMKEEGKALFEAREAERVAYVLEKYEQQFRNNCEELRNITNDHRCKTVLKERKEQIAEKRKQESLRSKEEKSFMATWKADMEVKALKEERDRMEKKALSNQTHCVILQQIADKEAKRKEEEVEKVKELEGVMKEMKNIELDKIAEQEKRKEKMKKSLEEINEHMRLKKAFNEEHRLNELQHNQTLLQQSTSLQTEQAKAKLNKIELKRTQDNYLQYSAFVKEERLRQEKKDEMTYQKEGELSWQKLHSVIKETDAVKKSQLLAIVAERKQRIDRKDEQKRNKVQEDRVEMQGILKDLQHLKQKEKHTSEQLQQKNHSHYEALKCQVRYRRGLMEEEQAEGRRMKQRQQEAEEEYLRKVQEMKKNNPAAKLPGFSCVQFPRIKSVEFASRYQRCGMLNL